MSVDTKKVLKRLVDDNDVSIIGIDSRYTTDIEKFAEILGEAMETKAYTLHVKLHKPKVKVELHDISTISKENWKGGEGTIEENKEGGDVGREIEAITEKRTNDTLDAVEDGVVHKLSTAKEEEKGD